MATFKSIFLAMIAAASAFTTPAASHLRRATIRSEQKGYYVPRPANKDISKSGGAPPPPRPASTDDAAAAESLAALMNSRKPAPPPPRPEALEKLEADREREREVAREAEAAKEREREQIRQQQLAAEAQAREREEQLRREQAEAKQQAEARRRRQREAELRAQQAREERLRQEQARVEQARRVPVAPQLDQTVPVQTERVPVAPQLDQTVPVQTERVPVAPQLEETVPVQTERVPVAPQMEATAPCRQRVRSRPRWARPPPPEGSRVLVPEAPSAEPAWASVTSGGAPPAAPNAKPLKSMSPVEFQKQWASNIIATAGRQKKLGELKQVMGDLADKVAEAAPPENPLPPAPAAASPCLRPAAASAQGLQVSPSPCLRPRRRAGARGEPLPPVPAAEPLPEVSPGALRLADIFDGRLGPALARSDDAMMSLSGVFTAYAANKPASGRDLVALRCANGAEIVIDAARCRDVSFDDRRAPDGDAALSVFFPTSTARPSSPRPSTAAAGPPPRRAGGRHREAMGVASSAGAASGEGATPL
ncbi:hypothetical protein JL721_8097 [Aureococcus anophagefferens]|nr:hypothetical protein JL721_8097 [Aureococcus anophagefferens]